MYYEFLTSYFSIEILYKIVRILFILSTGLLFTNLLIRFIKHIKSDILSHHIRFLLMHGVWYLGIAFLSITILSEFGFHVGTILGAAGIAGAALGFASQTSLSNVISGLFLVTEHSFEVGDTIIVSDITGTIITIGLLSIKLRQQDGTLVRIPNEHVIKNSLVNVSYFSERRFDFRLSIAYTQDINKVMTLLNTIIMANNYTLKNKKPYILCDELKDTNVSLFVGVWSTKNNFINLKKTILTDIKNGFMAHNIELPPYQIEVTMKNHH